MRRGDATGRPTSDDAAADTGAAVLGHLSRHLIEASPLAMAAVEGPQHRVCAVSPAFCRLTGAPCETVVGRPFAEVVPAWAGSQALLDRVSRTGEAETAAAPPQSGSVSGSWSCAVWPVRGPGEPPGGLAILMSEMSDNDAFRRQLIAMNEALVVSTVQQHERMEAAESLTTQVTERKTLLETILEQSTDEIVVRNAQGELLVANAAVRKQLRPVPEGQAHLMGTPLEQVPRLWGDMLDADGRVIPPDQYPIARVLRGERVPPLEFLREAPDGRRRTLINAAMALLDGQGAIVGAVAISTDITDRKTKEDDSRLAHAELERKVVERTSTLSQAFNKLHIQSAKLRVMADEERALRTDLEARLRFEALLTDLSARFIAAVGGHVDAMIEATQAEIGQVLELDRSAVLQRTPTDGDLVVTHSWSAPEWAGRPATFTKRDFPWTHETLLRGDSVFFTTPEELPAEAARDKEAFRAIEQKSRAFLPMIANNVVIGALSFGTLSAERAWPDALVRRFKLVADILANALARERNGRALRAALADATRLREQLEAENIYLRETNEAAPAEIVGHSPALKRVLSQIDHVAPTDASVLLLGETGTGKELLAQLIHRRSRRKDRTMVKLHCAALPPTLIEAELFGREKGAYTGALTRQAGRFELADGSTIFLDEIGELPVELQVKLLRVLEDGEIERIGSTKTLTVNVRVIAATNRDLAARVAHGTFREDLYYRLNVFPIAVPPLRERDEDISLLVWTFAKHFGQVLGKPVERISQPTMDALKAYHWPGNIRELRNVIERAVILSESSTLQIPVGVAPVPKAVAAPTLAATERVQILAALDKTGWRIRGPAGAGALLGLKPTTLESRIKKLGLQRPR